MKVHYNKDEDTLMIQVGDEKVDDAYETSSMIVHVSESREPVLLEIFQATKLLKTIVKTLPLKVKTAAFAQI